MKFCKILLPAVALLAFFAGSAVQSQAQGRHPAYLHALSDLRLMRAYLERATPSERIDADQQHAIDEIDAAIREIKAASIEDGKNLNDHPPVDANLTRNNRFRKAREAGNAAWADLNREEDNDFAHGLKRRAMGHIEEANHTVDKIIRRIDAHKQ